MPLEAALFQGVRVYAIGDGPFLRRPCFTIVEGPFPRRPGKALGTNLVEGIHVYTLGLGDNPFLGRPALYVGISLGRHI